MKMASDNLKNAAEQRSAARKNYIEERVKALPNDLDGLNENQLLNFVRDLHHQLAQTEEHRYDLEMKIRKQDYEVRLSASSKSIFIFLLQINELTIKVNDIKGKFIKPALKKVSKTTQK